MPSDGSYMLEVPGKACTVDTYYVVVSKCVFDYCLCDKSGLLRGGETLPFTASRGGDLSSGTMRTWSAGCKLRSLVLWSGVTGIELGCGTPFLPPSGKVAQSADPDTQEPRSMVELIIDVALS